MERTLTGAETHVCFEIGVLVVAEGKEDLVAFFGQYRLYGWRIANIAHWRYIVGGGQHTQRSTVERRWLHTVVQTEAGERLPFVKHAFRRLPHGQINHNWIALELNFDFNFQLSTSNRSFRTIFLRILTAKSPMGLFPSPKCDRSLTISTWPH